MGFGDIPACGDGGYSTEKAARVPRGLTPEQFTMSIIPVRIAVKSKSYYYVIKCVHMKRHK